MSLKISDDFRTAWSAYIIDVGSAGKALGRANQLSSLTPGVVKTGKEVGRTPSKSVWWLPDSGAAAVQIGADWEKFKKDVNKLGDSLAVESPVAALKKAQTVRALTIGGTVLVTIAGAVATVATLGAAAPAAAAGTAAAAGSIGTVGTIAGVGTVVGATALAAGKIIAATPAGKKLTLIDLTTQLASKARELQNTPVAQKNKRTDLTKQIQSLQARVAMTTAEINTAQREKAQAGRAIAESKQLQQQVVVYGGAALGTLALVGLVVYALR